MPILSSRGAMSAQGFGMFGVSKFWSTWNPADKSSSITLSNGNTTATMNSSGLASGVRGTLSHGTGKYYFEVTLLFFAGSTVAIGVADSAHVLSVYAGLNDAHGASYLDSGSLRANTNGTNIGAQTTFASGQVIGVAVDIPNTLIYWSNNGAWQNSAVPASGTGGVNYITTSPVFPCVLENYNLDAVTLNVGASAFAYTPPSGFSAWQ